MIQRTKTSCNRATRFVVAEGALFANAFARSDAVGKAAWGWDVLTALLSVVDVVSDVWVAQQFYDARHMGWFWLVVLSLFVANCVYTPMMVRNAMTLNLIDDTGRAFAKYFVVLFPVAQLFPLLKWLWETHSQLRAQRNNNNTSAPATQEDAASDASPNALATSELASGAASRKYITRFSTGVQLHLKAHMGFLVETAVEAVPQLLIQLVAVSCIGDATSVQLLSLGLSLMTIVSKAYVVSITYDATVMVCRAALTAFGLFSLCFVFSSVHGGAGGVDQVAVPTPGFLGVGTEEDGAWIRWSTVETTAVSAWHLRGLGRRAAALALVAAGCGLGVVGEEWQTLGVKQAIRSIGMGVVVGTVLLAPTVLVLEAVPFGAILLCLLASDASRGRSRLSAAYCATAFTFLTKGVTGRVDSPAKRLQHLLTTLPMLPDDRTFPMVNGVIKPEAQRQREITSNAFASLPLDAFTSWASFRQATKNFPRHPAGRRACRALPEVVVAPYHSLLRYGIVVTMDEVKEKWLLFIAKPPLQKTKDVYFVILASLFFLVVGDAALSNVMFPPRWVWHEGASAMNPLQRMCGVGWLVSLLIAASTAPRLRTYVLFNEAVQLDRQWFLGGRQWASTAEHAARQIRQYHHPPTRPWLKSGINPCVLSHDVVEMVADYVGEANLAGLSAVEIQVLLEMGDGRRTTVDDGHEETDLQDPFTPTP